MVSIFEKNISNDKRIFYGLCTVKGIGKTLSKRICNHLGIDGMRLVGSLNRNEWLKIIKFLGKDFLFGKSLDRNVISFRRKQIAIRSLRGICYMMKLPVNGQSTHSNAKTVKRQNFKDV